MAVVFPVSAFFPARRFHPVRPGSGQAADSGMPVRFVLAGRLYETLAIFPVPVVAVFLWTGCRPVTVVLVGAGCLFLPEGCFGFRLRFDVPASGKRSFRRALACRDGEAGFWPECLCSVRAAISRLATCPDACFSGLFLPRGGMGKSRDGLSGYRQAGCFAIGRNPVRSSVPVLLSVIFLCLDKACLAKWFMLEGPGFQVVRELVFREAV